MISNSVRDKERRNQGLKAQVVKVQLFFTTFEPNLVIKNSNLYDRYE
jgi:hypothetical protein